jgi:hypothetical protein
VLAAYLRGDHQACSMVRVPTSEEEDAKRVDGGGKVGHGAPA